MTQRVRRLLILAALAVALAAASTFAQTPPAPSQTPPPAPAQILSAAQLQTINGLIATQGREIAVTPLITDILGLTKDNQTISCRAFAAEGEGNEVHQIYLLPNGKGYLAVHFYQDKLDVYWTDSTFGLIAALNGIRGQKPAASSFADAQYGFAFESAWWAKYAAGH